MVWLAVFALFLVWFSGWISEFWIFKYPNLRLNEALKSLEKPLLPEHTSLVVITSEEYECEEYFGGKSPLNPDVLGKAIRAVLDRNPAVLVVDIDTSAAAFGAMSLGETKTRIVWARSIHRVKGKTYTGRVLGEAAGAKSQGFAASPPDPDGAIRSFPRELFTDGKYFATVHWRAVQEFRALKEGRQAPAWGTPAPESVNLEVARLSNNYNYELHTKTLADFLPPVSANCKLPDKATPNTENLDGKIVVFGGNYQFGNTHKNPFDEKWGVEILGSAIEAELSGNGVGHIPGKWIFKLAIGAVIGLLFHFLFALPATILSLAVLTLIALAGNIVAVVFGYEGAVIPFVLGVLIEQLVNLLEQAQEAQVELEKEYGSVAARNSQPMTTNGPRS
jgi:hypothetical protein